MQRLTRSRAARHQFLTLLVCVCVVREGLGLAAAASFKHVSPAGAGLAVPLTADEAAAYEVRAMWMRREEGSRQASSQSGDMWQAAVPASSSIPASSSSSLSSG